jgi:hypothetical protein
MHHPAAAESAAEARPISSRSIVANRPANNAGTNRAAVRSHWFTLSFRGVPELVVRFSHVNLDDGAVQGGSFDKTYLGINWLGDPAVEVRHRVGTHVAGSLREDGRDEQRDYASAVDLLNGRPR